jgi:hypothetical protein
MAEILCVHCRDHGAARCDASGCDRVRGWPWSADQCRPCLVRLFGPPPALAARAALSLSCAHRGEPTGETRECAACAGKVDVPIRRCAVHGQCTETKLLAGVRCCTLCADRKAKPLIQLETPTAGIGDVLLTACVAEGLRRQHPSAEVAIVCQGFAHPWVSLVGGADRAALTRGPGLVALCDNHPTHEWKPRGKARWEYWQELHGTRAAVPEPRPLPAHALEWAAPFAGRVALAPFAAFPERRWPLDRWVDAERLLLGQGFACLILDDKPDRTAAFRSPKLIGEAPARVAAALRYCVCFAGNDSGMAHLAGMLGVPGVAVSAHASDDNIMGLYPTIRELGGRRLGFEGVTAADVVAAVLAQVRARLGDFPADAFMRTLPERDHRGESWLPIYAALWRTVRELRPQRVVEIGVRAGQSAWTILDACPGAELHGIDLDGDIEQSGGFSGAHEHARRLLEGRPFALQLADSHTLDRIPPCDLCYVDGDHSEDGCYQDLRLAERSGAGKILVDDYTHLEGVRRAVARFLAEQPHRKGRFIPSQTGLFLIA